MTPNSLGAELVGVQPSKTGLDIHGILNAIKEKKIKALYLIEDDIVEAFPEFENAIAGLESIYSSFNKSEQKYSSC